MNRKCIHCNEVKSIEEFGKDKRASQGRTSKCKQCHNLYNRGRYSRKGRVTKKLDYYVVYYLPEEHYCGHTNKWPRRCYEHKSLGRNTDGARVLFTTKTKTEAIYYEALFCSTLGINGLKLR